MLPDVWGKYAWNFIHLVPLDYPLNPTEEDKKNYKDFYLNLQYILPCAKCRAHYKDHLKILPLTDNVLSNRSKLLKWTIDMHNIVNYYTGKPMLTLTEAMDDIDKLSHPSNTWNWIFFMIIIIVLVIFIYFMIYRK